MVPDSPFAADWVAFHAAHDPDAPAIGSPNDGWTTYAELLRLVRATTTLLAADGIGSGDHVVLVLASSARSVATGLAVQSLGAVCVELSGDLGIEAFAEVIRQTDARAAIVAASDAATWAPLLDGGSLDRLYIVGDVDGGRNVEQTLAGRRWAWLTDESAGPAPARPAPTGPGLARHDVHDVDRPALVVYTSGSTGAPRGVIQTHANIDANTHAIVRYLELDASDRAMATLPLYYCYGRSVLQTHLLVGASVFFDHRFMYPRIVLDELARQRCTGFAGVPLTFESLKRRVDVAALELPTLRYVTQAGGRMHPDTISWAREAFAPARLFVMYGQTEATARLAYLPPERADAKQGSVGHALDNVELAILDDSAEPVATGVVGNVVARGPSITPGYLDAPSETESILHHGWLWTGDIGYLDEEGYLFLVGRAKDFLKLGGHRVTAAEIEEVLARHPAVEMVVVVGTIDENGAEQAVAVVTLSEGATVDANELRRHCRQAMPAFKVPKHVRFVTSLPLTASGKIAKSEVQRWIDDDAIALT